MFTGRSHLARFQNPPYRHEQTRDQDDQLGGNMNEPRGQAEVAPANKYHVLIVEDNPDGRETLRTLLELLGYDVEVAEDGVTGVNRALSMHPDIALVDIGLPGLDGYEVARRVRAGLGRTVRLVAVTAYGQPEDRKAAFAAGFDGHIIKPVDLNELITWLQMNNRTP